MKEFTKVAIVEYRNGGSCVFRFNSNKEMSLKDVYEFLVENDDFNEEKDSLTIVDEIITVDITY